MSVTPRHKLRLVPAVGFTASVRAGDAAPETVCVCVCLQNFISLLIGPCTTNPPKKEKSAALVQQSFSFSFFLEEETDCEKPDDHTLTPSVPLQ